MAAEETRAKLEVADSVATVTPTSSTAPAPLPSMMPPPVPEAPPPTPVNGAMRTSAQVPDLPPSSSATTGPVPDPLDLSALKVSMDAAMANLGDSEKAATPPPAKPQPADDDKQAQLRAMYLAGFQAAQARHQAHRKKHATRKV